MKKSSLDTETTGLDVRHGARPFFVTMCDSEGEVTFWQWRVDPLDRTIIPETDDYDLFEDLKEIQKAVLELDVLAAQNWKFDFGMMSALFGDYGLAFEVNWDAVHDLLFSAHLLHSNKPKDLTTQAMMYLEVDITPYEQAIDRACKEARRYCRSKHKDWSIAKAGRPDMPSAKEKCGKFDMWLPGEVAIRDGLDEDHEWRTSLPEYGNADSAVTLPIHEVHVAQIKARGLEKIYEVRRKLPRIVTGMERRGITVSRKRLNELKTTFAEEAASAERKCIKLAGSGPCLKCDGGANPPSRGVCSACEGTGTTVTLAGGLPKAGTSLALRQAIFGNLGIKPSKAQNRKKKTDTPSIDKFAMEEWLATLPPRSKQLSFISNLRDYRKRVTSLSYMEGYGRFGRPVPRTWMPTGVWNKKGEQLWILLHPGLNATGSDTLRWSSQNPNEQNISKQEGFNLRYAFGPLPGREWWSKDAKNIELRIPAYKSGEQSLIELFERPDDPPYYGSNHLLNFHTVYEDLWNKELKTVGFEKVGPHCKKKYAASWYQWCKNGGFCKQYGGQEALTDATFKRKGAYRLIESRFANLSGLNQHCIDYANEYGYIETVPDTTVDPDHGYPLWCTRTEYGGILPTVPFNYYTQGSAMWWTMMAMIRVQAYLDELNSSIPPKELDRYGYFLVMQVHDECVFDFPYVKDMGNLPIAQEVARLMSIGGEGLGVPTPVGIEYHENNWAEGVTVQ